MLIDQAKLAAAMQLMAEAFAPQAAAQPTPEPLPEPAPQAAPEPAPQGKPQEPETSNVSSIGGFADRFSQPPQAASATPATPAAQAPPAPFDVDKAKTHLKGLLWEIQKQKGEVVGLELLMRHGLQKFSDMQDRQLPAIIAEAEGILNG